MLLLGAVVCAAGFTLVSLQVKDWMLDDAFISFRYAQNLARGHGLVYNPGARIEGYTNFLWTFLLALFRLVGLDIVTVSRILGLLLGIAALAATGYTAWRRRAASRPAAALVSMALLASLGMFAAWSLSGMEVMLIALLLVLAVSGFQSATSNASSPASFLLVGSALALAAMTRPEGLLATAVLVAASLTNPGQHGRLRTALLLLAGFGFLYIPYYVWRYLYYGYLLPNTFYAKVGFSPAQFARGLGYLRDFALPHVPILLLAAVGAFVERRQLMLRTSAVLVLVLAAYVATIGGDCMPAFRFIAPVAPFVCLLAAAGIEAIARGLRRPAARAAAAVLLAAVLVAFNLLAGFRSPHIFRSIAMDRVARYGRIVGERLGRMARPEAVVATNTAGTIPYYSGLRTIDMLGMNDAHIAHQDVPLGIGRAGHEKSDGAYVLAQRPDYIQFGSSWGSDQPLFRGDSEIARLPDFPRLYQLSLYPLEGEFLFALFELRTDTDRHE